MGESLFSDLNRSLIFFSRCFLILRLLEDMAPKVVELAIFHIKPLKQHVVLQSHNSIAL